ncbi:putative diacylglycerol acyltransferase [Septoria linicola]|nr:putative diacylglycerol acyltransferase [Septoria linicola]
MSLNPEPADPAEREDHHLPPKSYADAVEEDPIDAQDPILDESAIKETPPRPVHSRNGSGEPRAFGEILDEALPSPGSPTLRHPKGRLEAKKSRDTYAGAVKEHSPAPNGLANGDGHGLPVKEIVRNSINTHTFDGVGESEPPQSPTRRAHKRISSRTLNGDANRPKSSDSQKDMTGIPEKSNGKALEPNDLSIDLIRNKSGENLASVKRNEDDFLSLQQTEDKPANSRQVQRERRDSELTSGRRAGEGWARSAVRWAPLNVPVQRRLQTLMVLVHTLSIVGSLTIFLFLCGIPLLWPILVPYLVYVLFSQVSVDGSLAQRSEFWRRNKIWSLFASYFPARLHRSQELEPNRKYIFGYHPHGIISHGAFAAFATEALGFSQLFPGITNTLLTLDSNFRIPLYREYALRMGLASVSRESCENILSRGGPNKEGMGRAITIVVGGARESLDAKPYTLRLVLRRRKGFVKLAVRCGADLVPTLAFGENDIYDQFDSDSHPWIHKGQMFIKKLMGFTVPLFHARGVFNYDVGMMPYRRPINIVVGRPIRTIQNETPDPAYVDELHTQYVAELQRIWDDWRDTFARDRKGELEIVE